MTTKFPISICKLPTTITCQFWYYIKHLVARLPIMTTYRLNALIKLAIMTVNLLSVTYEIALDEKNLEQLSCHGGNFCISKQLSIRSSIMVTYHPNVFLS